MTTEEGRYERHVQIQLNERIHDGVGFWYAIEQIFNDIKKTNSTDQRQGNAAFRINDSLCTDVDRDISVTAAWDDGVAG